jgi:hypothetical protein
VRNVVASLGQERGERGVGLLGAFDLRHVSAVELEVAGVRKRFGDVALERDWYKPVATAPDE